MFAALHSIVLLMPFNSKVKQIESQTTSWNGLCSTFEGPLYFVCQLYYVNSKYNVMHLSNFACGEMFVG
jgi:hypothetical protein